MWYTGNTDCVLLRAAKGSGLDGVLPKSPFALRKSRHASFNLQGGLSDDGHKGESKGSVQLPGGLG